MGDAKQYQIDLERLMASVEEKEDRIADEKARRFVEDLISRGKAVGIKFSEIAKRFQADNGFDGILAEIRSREGNQTPK